MFEKTLNEHFCIVARALEYPPIHRIRNQIIFLIIDFIIILEPRYLSADLLQEVKALVGAEQVIRRPNVALISIFGPDFRERPGIAGTMFAALGAKGINILAISTSISTLTCVIDADHLTDAVAAMRETFDLP